jgi:type II secretory pathway pseudopilin PulG
VKPLRSIHALVGIAVMAFACIVAWSGYQHFRIDGEASRIERVLTAAEDKLAAFQRANGRYPDSLKALIFTNSPQEVRMIADIQNINYQRIKDGYVLSYEGAFGYKNTKSFRSEPLLNR